MTINRINQTYYHPKVLKTEKIGKSVIPITRVTNSCTPTLKIVKIDKEEGISH